MLVLEGCFDIHLLCAIWSVLNGPLVWFCRQQLYSGPRSSEWGGLGLLPSSKWFDSESEQFDTKFTCNSQNPLTAAMEPKEPIWHQQWWKHLKRVIFPSLHQEMSRVIFLTCTFVGVLTVALVLQQLWWSYNTVSIRSQSFSFHYRAWYIYNKLWPHSEKKTPSEGYYNQPTHPPTFSGACWQAYEEISFAVLESFFKSSENVNLAWKSSMCHKKFCQETVSAGGTVV